jgi:hypothetical protein
METQPQSTRFGAPPEISSWSQRCRLQLIDFRLRWEGKLNRKDLESFFGISPQQATNDLAAYGQGDHDNLKYEPRLKAFVATPWFRPLYPTTASRFYLNELLSLQAGLADAGSTYIGWRPDLATVPAVGRLVDGDALTAILGAIRHKRMVNARYLEATKENMSFVMVSPHGLAYDGRRWYVRAYCHVRKAFRDLVLSRIADAQVGAQSAAEFTEDMVWHTQVTIAIAPRDGLSPGERASVQHDYGMSDGRLELPCRHVMLSRTLRSLQLLDNDSTELTLTNRDQLVPYLDLLRCDEHSNVP